MILGHGEKLIFPFCECINWAFYFVALNLGDLSAVASGVLRFMAR